MNKVVTPEMVRERLEAAFYTLDIPSEVERHTSTRLHSVTRGKQYGGACPFEDCLVDSDGFMVWPVLTPRGKHYHCRGCKRSGDILKLVQDIKGLGFSDACKELGIPNPYLDGDSASILPNAQMRRRVQEAEQWQLDELAYLNTIYPRTTLALRRERARAYLAERAISFELAEEQGLGYIPALSEVAHTTPELERFRRWCDRIIFPILTAKGERGYCGRTLFLWEPGMDEDEHKRRIDAYNLQMKEQYGNKEIWYQMPRWKYTYQQGFFNWQVVNMFDTLLFVEGPFDVLACMSIGILNAIPLGTTGLDVGRLPTSVYSAVIGLDVDSSGRKAAKTLAKGLMRKGVDVQVCMPVNAKDWSEAYRLHSIEGLAPLMEVIEKWQECSRCHVVSNALSEPFQIRDGQMLCSHCARASQWHTSPDAETPIVDGVCLCCTCLDHDMETPTEYGQGNFMYCAQHHPSRLELESFIEQISLSDIKVEYWTAANSDLMGKAIINRYQVEARQSLEYSPVSLPPLPRDACPCRTIAWNNLGEQVTQHCRRQPTRNGFCPEHQLAHEMLTIGAQLDYPSIQVPFKWKRGTLHRTIHAGVSCWEARACIAHAERPRVLEDDVVYLRSVARGSRNVF